MILDTYGSSRSPRGERPQSYLSLGKAKAERPLRVNWILGSLSYSRDPFLLKKKFAKCLTRIDLLLIFAL